MCYFDCNAPDTTGYSVATDGISVVTIHAHRQDDGVQCYKDIDSDFHSPFWIYIPVDQGEYLTEICRRYGYRVGKMKMDSAGIMASTRYFIVISTSLTRLPSLSPTGDGASCLDAMLQLEPSSLRRYIRLHELNRESTLTSGTQYQTRRSGIWHSKIPRAQRYGLIPARFNQPHHVLAQRPMNPGSSHLAI